MVHTLSVLLGFVAIKLLSLWPIGLEAANQQLLEVT
jgi:hypothetical protein